MATSAREIFLAASDDVATMDDKGTTVKAEACDGGGRQMVKIDSAKWKRIIRGFAKGNFGDGGSDANNNGNRRRIGGRRERKGRRKKRREEKKRKRKRGK